jgi:hypothetical protein
MLYPFFALAAVSPGRQRVFRSTVVAHLTVLAALAWGMRLGHPASAAPLAGHLLLVAAVVEGALLLGWRLTQLPRSQALEFLLVSPLRPPRVFLAEALVGVCRLALVTLSGLPVLALLAADGFLDTADLAPLLVVPLTWGALTGLGLAAWAYEPVAVRRWGERLMVALVLLYLVVGMLAGEHLKNWLAVLPEDVGLFFLNSFEAFHRYNPFAVLQHWLTREDPIVAWERMVGVELGALAAVGLLTARAAGRLQGHFRDRHYRPVADPGRGERGRVGERPLAWWAVRRVTEYSGRINLWLAGGCGVLYALYTVAGADWPAWLGRRAFEIFDRAGGVPALAAALVVLAAVPAAFQYGLWDSNAQDRCRRLELLLLTRLGARDYWEAAAAAAWKRGRGYFAVAVLLWTAAVLGGQAGWSQALAALAAGVVLWGLYFALGFRAFARGIQANGLGMLLTVGLPLLAYALYRGGWPVLGALVPPGSVYEPGSAGPSPAWLPGPVLGAASALCLARLGLAHCDRDLRGWYDRHHGRKVMD